ncbi:outer membrane protein assembly factor BamB family protein [Botrimarina mediterranea]|uniref:Outer membrane protein assembly factor BamB n=1 Tax=Botrimarina mediterranea TaxID=2528022 RepID=A0A518K572_9BACT|nr:PQQ-binding-like beta-propeller repeat protein [Botrimarina mediterranea]QDV72940.1 Outer membrane protein assembly factor BamB [Botrimarina mediterranea]
MMRYFLAPMVLLAAASAAQAQDWLQWRGPTGDNHAAEGATAPTEWSEEAGLAWKTPVPGHGHSSPTIVGDRIYLITADADAQTQSLLIYGKESGELLREVLTHEGGLPAQIHPSNSHATSTVASDGERVFALFYNDDAAVVTAYDLQGERLWQERVGGFDPKAYQFGFGSSPRLVDGTLVVASEYDGPDSGIYGLDPKTGKRFWTAPRSENLSWSSPSVTPVGGKSQLLMSGAKRLVSYEPVSGKVLWSLEDESTEATCGTMVWDEKLGLAFASGGFPDAFTLAVKLDGDHEVVWRNKIRNYEQSLLVVDGYVYATADRGIAFCWRGSDGKEMWRERLGGKFSASPLLVGKTIYATNESGTTHVYEANPERFVRVAQNQLGDSAFATTTPSAGRLYHRYAKTEGGKRQEYLAAIGD